MRLKSMSGGHGALQMVISQLGEVRSSLKAFTQAQATASEDTMRWAAAHENRAIAETFSHLAELSLVWTDVQRDFTGLFRVMARGSFRLDNRSVCGIVQCSLFVCLLIFRFFGGEAQ